MEKRNILIVFYSRTGNTRRIATDLADKLGCDIEEIVDETPRAGLLGYLRSGFDASFQRVTLLQQPIKDPAAYDLVIIGSPIWNASLSAPVRNYLSRMRGRIREAAFFVTCGGMGSRRVFRQMTGLLSREPRAVLEVREDELEGDRYRRKLDAFAAKFADAAPARSPQAHVRSA